MPDATKNIIKSAAKAPALAELLKRDPAQLLTSLANSEQGQAAIKAGTQLIGDFMKSLTSGGASQPKSSKPARPLTHSAGPRVASLASEAAPNGESSSVAILGVTSLAAIAGSVAVLGAVSILALSKKEN